MPQTVISRAKIKCVETGHHADGTYRAKFIAVYDQNPASENGKFFKYTPALMLDTGTINDQGFEAGQEYYLDFIPVQVAEP